MGFHIRRLSIVVLIWGFKYVACLELPGMGFHIRRLPRDVLPSGFKYVVCLQLYCHVVSYT